MKKKLGIYARQSREKETTGSIDDQIVHGHLKAKELGLEYETYVDRDASAAYDTLDNRPSFKRLIKDIQAGLIEAVYVIDESRLTRDLAIKVLIKKVFAAYKIKVHTKIDGVIDFDDFNSSFMSDFKTLFAARMVRETSVKISSVLENRVQQGKIHTGVIKPYGFKADSEKNIIVDDDEAVIVQKIYSMCLMGYGSKKIAKELNKQGISTKTAKLHELRLKYNAENPECQKPTPYDSVSWAPNTVLNILNNSIYKGKRLYKGKYYDVPQIVTEEVWDLAQNQIKKNTNAPGLSKYNYLLKNLIVCGHCGSTFCGRTRPNKRDHIYYCSSKYHKVGKCGIRSINITTLDSLIWTMVASSDVVISQAKEEVIKIKNPLYVKEMSEEVKSLEKKISSETNNKLKIFSMLKKDLLSEEEAEKEMRICKNRVEEYNGKLKEFRLKLEDGVGLANRIDEAEQFVQQWENLVFNEDFDLQYQIVRMFIEKIQINFDEKSDTYTVIAYAKLPEIHELLSVQLNLQGNIKPLIIDIPAERNRNVYSVINRPNRENLEIEPFNSSTVNTKKKVFLGLPPKGTPEHPKSCGGEI